MIAPRFRTQEDAALFLECVKNNSPFPPEKWVWPFAKFGNAVVTSDEYRTAPFQVDFIYTVK